MVLIVRIGCLLTAVSLLFGHALAQENAPPEGSDELAWAAGASQQMAEPNLGAWILTGSGVASFGVGLTLFLVAKGEHAELSDPVRDADGRVRGVTQREVAREEQQIADRVRSGVILMSIGALLGTGGVLWDMFDTNPKRDVSPFERAPVHPFGWHVSGSDITPLQLNYSGSF